MATPEPLPARVVTRQFDAGRDMEAARLAANAARLGTEEGRSRELRQVCMAYAMKLAEKRDDPTEATAIVRDAELFYNFFSKV